MVDKTSILNELAVLTENLATFRTDMLDELGEFEEQHDEWEETLRDDGEYEYAEPDKPEYEDALNYTENLINAIDDLVKVLR